MFSSEYRRHYKELYRIAYPVALGQVGHMLASISDNIMIGQVGSVHLAASSLANAVFIVFFVFGIGTSMGVTPLVGKAFGQGDKQRCAALFKSSLALNGIVGVVLAALLVAGAPLLKYLDQPAEVVELALPYFFILILSLLPYMPFLAMKQFAEGMAVTKPAMIIIVAWNAVNIVLNYVLIYGKFGFEPLGLIGAGWATLIARVGMALSFAGFMYYARELREFMRGGETPNRPRAMWRAIWSVGFPNGVQFVLEISYFVCGAIIIGWLGAQHLAAHQIAVSLISVTYLVASGIAAAATVRVSTLIGVGELRQMRIAGYSSIILAAIFMGCAAILLVILRHELPELYVSEREVIAIASSLIAISALFQLFDGIQVTALGALRGLTDMKTPTLIALISYWCIGLPASYALAIPFGFGAAGVWYGYLVGLCVAAGLLTWRLEVVARRRIVAQ